MAEAVGAASVGLSAKGNAYNMALAQGYTKEQAQIYSTLIGASEAGLQYALGGISDLGGKLTNKAVQRTIANIDNSLLRLSADLGLKALGEGSEEYIQELLDPVFRNIAFQEGNELSLISEEGMYSFLLAVFTTGVLEFKNSYHDNVTLKKSGNQFIAAGLTQDVIDAGLKLKEGSAGRQLAEQLASGVYDSNGANIGQLADIYAKETGDNSLGKKLSEQSDKLGEIVQKADQLEVRQQKNDAQANLKPFSEHEAKNLLSSAKNKVVGFGATIQSFVQEAISSKGQKGGRLYVGKLSNHTVEIVRNATGIDVSGFSSIINSSEVWHAFKHHSDKKIEDQRGQVAITEEDFKLLPGILSDPDRVELSTDSDGFGRPALFFTKVIGDEYITVQGYSDKRKGLFFDSMWIKKDASRHASLLENNPPRGQRPKRSAGTASVEASASDISISSSGEKVNAKTGEQSAAQAKDLAKDQTIDQGAEFAANLEELRRLAKEMGLEVVGSEETNGENADTAQPVQRKAWEDLSPEMQAEISNAILQYADDNVNMGQGEIRTFEGDEAFIQAFYEDYLRGEDGLAEWDAPTVNIQKLAEQLDGIQGGQIYNHGEVSGESNFGETVENSENDGIISLGNNHPRNKQLEKAIEKSIKSDRPIFAEGRFKNNCGRIKPKKGFYDVSLHGAPTHGEIFNNKITPEILDNIIKARSDYSGESIRLISCSTGKISKNGDCFAQKLADILGVPVEAPTDTIWIHPSGSFTIGQTIASNDGEMIIFYPKDKGAGLK